MEGEQIILVVVVVVALTVVLSLWSRRQQQSTWSGVVVDKSWEEDEEKGRTYYKVIFRTDKGKQTVTYFNRADYDGWAVGDRGEKASGEYLPRRLA